MSAIDQVTPEHLAAGRFADSDSPRVIAFARGTAGAAVDSTDAVVRLYYAVRDQVTYDPYVDCSDPGTFRASEVLARGRGFCIGKACVLAACARVFGVASRLGFADVRNHLTSPRLYEMLKTDTFRWHAYAEVCLNGKWVKATPAFDAGLCARVGVKTLEFDGQTDSLFQPYDRAGRRHMEYVAERGTFADVPFEVILADFAVHHPAMVGAKSHQGDFQRDAVAGDG